jgi:hypothetical protein
LRIFVIQAVLVVENGVEANVLDGGGAAHRHETNRNGLT